MHLVLLRLSALGDILRVLPAWKNIVDAFPKARIQAVVEDRHGFLLEALPGVEPVLVARKKLSSPFAALPELRRVGNLTRGADASLDFHGILKSALVPWLAGIGERWGDGVTKEFAGGLQNRSVARARQSRYAQALGLASAFGQSRGVPGLGSFRPFLKEAPLPENSPWPPEAQMRPHGGRPRPRVLLVPGTSRAGAYKRWPLPMWIRLARELGTEADLRWSLGPDEAALRPWLPEKSRVEALPPLPFWGLAAAMRGADRVVVGDTGLLHLAVLLGVPVTAIMGPSDPVVSGIPSGCGAIVRAYADCSPCREKRCLRRQCMEGIRVDDVLAAL